MPAFSVVVPAYNMQDYIEEALDSIAAQSFTDFEAIIIDDGSTDATAETAKRFCGRDSRFRYLNQPNRGLSASRNLGTSVAKGTFVFYMDSDDIIDVDTLSECHQAFTREEVDVVLFEADIFPADSPMYQFEEHYFRRPLGQSPLWSDDFVIESLQQERYCVSACCLMVRRSAIANLRFIDGIVYEDNHFFLSLLLEQRRKVAVLNKKFYKRRLRPDSIMFATKTPHHYYSMYRLLREMSKLSFGAIKPPAREAIKREIIGRTLGDLCFASSLVGPNLRLRQMNVVATWHVATHVSPRLLAPKRLLLALVPELYKLKAEARLHR
jgi:glycosyltransferase involved in cell wall biosynthesis